MHLLRLLTIALPAASLLLVAATPPAAASGQQAGHAHEHGFARIDLVLEGRRLSLRLEAPLDTLVGFEHAPRTAAERRRADAALAMLRSADRLFGIDPAAGCTLSRVELDAPALTTGTPGHPEAGARGHAELAADIAFECRDGGRLAFIEVGLFKAFPRLQRLAVQAVTRSGQFKRRLTPQATRLDLSPR